MMRAATLAYRLVFASVLTTFVLGGFARAAEHTRDTLDKVKENLAGKKAVLLDVRELEEWKEAHLQDAQSLPLSELKKLAADPAGPGKLEKQLRKDRIVYCHCALGRRALAAGDILSKLGYDVRPLKSSYNELEQAGFAPAKK